MTLDTSQALPAGYELGAYTIIRTLMEGAFGITYLAKDAVLGSEVLICELLPYGFASRHPSVSVQVCVSSQEPGGIFFEEVVQDFLDEARMLASLDHPNIVKVMGAFEALGTAYYVMPHAKGEYLDSYTRRYGVPGEEALRALLLPLLHALDYLHGKGQLHGDITSSRIALSESGEPILLHVDMFRRLLREKSPSEAPEYSPGERLPEQDYSRPSADIYALAEVMYKLISREHLPKGRERQPGNDPYVPLATQPKLQGVYSQALLQSLDKALSCSPQQRWAAAEWARELEGSAPTPAEKTKAAPTPRRHPLWRGLGYALPALLGLGIGLGAEQGLAVLKALPMVSAQGGSEAAAAPAEASPSTKLRRLFSIPTQVAIESVLFSPDGRLVATVDADKAVRLWNVKTRRQVGDTVQHGEYLAGIAFSPDGSVLASCSQDKTVRLLHTRTGRLVASPLRLDYRGYSTVNGLLFSPDGRTLAVRGSGAVTLVDVHTGQALGEPMRFRDLVERMIFSDDGRELMVCASDVTFWDVATQQEVERDHELSYGAHKAIHSPDKRLLATSSYDKTASLWDATTLKRVGEAIWHKDYVSDVEFSPNGRFLATSAGDCAFLWDVETQRQVGETMRHGLSDLVLEFNADGSRLATATHQYIGGVRLWDGRRGTPIGEPLKLRGRLTDMAFSPDGLVIACSADDNTLRFWNALTGHPLSAPLPHDGVVRDLEFSPDGKMLLCGDEGAIHFWEVPSLPASGKPCEKAP